MGEGERPAVLPPLFERTSVTASGWGVGGAVVVGDDAATDPAGVTGFMRSPLRTTGDSGGEAALGTGEAVSTFSRCAWR